MTASFSVGTGLFKYETISNTVVEAVPNEFYNGPKPAKVAKMHWDGPKDDTARLAAALGWHHRRDGDCAVGNHADQLKVSWLDSG